MRFAIAIPQFYADEAGAELILCTALFDQAEQMEQLAAAVIPELG